MNAPLTPAINLLAAAERIKLLLQRSAGDIITIGSELLAVKAAVEHGEFLAWIDSEFAMTARTAQRFMSVAERFGNTTPVSHLPPTVLYELAAPSTPETVIEEVKDRAAKGEKVTATEIKLLRAKAAEADRLRADNEALQKSRRDLAEKVSDLCGENERLQEPRTITVKAAPQDLEPQYQAFAAHWRSLPMELRERFFREFPTAYCAPVSERFGGVASEAHEPGAPNGQDRRTGEAHEPSGGESSPSGTGNGSEGGGPRAVATPRGGGNGGGDGAAGEPQASAEAPAGLGDDAVIDPFANLTFGKNAQPDFPEIPLDLVRDDDLRERERAARAAA